MSPASSALHIKHTHTSKHFVIFVGISALINVHRLFLSYLCLCRLVVSCHLQLRIHITLQFPPSLITLPLFLILFLTIFLVSLLQKKTTTITICYLYLDMFYTVLLFLCSLLFILLFFLFFSCLFSTFLLLLLL